MLKLTAPPGTSKLFVDERMFIHYILFNPRISGWNITKSLMFSQKAMYRTFLTGKILFYIRIFLIFLISTFFGLISE